MALRLAQGAPQGALAALAPILAEPGLLSRPLWLAQACVLEAIAEDALDDQAAAARALERALDLAEPDRMVMPFVLYPAERLLERHARSRGTHAFLVAEIQALLKGTTR
ncbi:MAG: hypothetical protein ACRD1F_08345, partial [Terriglobales bacterium]